MSLLGRGGYTLPHLSWIPYLLSDTQTPEYPTPSPRYLVPPGRDMGPEIPYPNPSSPLEPQKWVVRILLDYLIFSLSLGVNMPLRMARQPLKGKIHPVPEII